MRMVHLVLTMLRRGTALLHVLSVLIMVLHHLLAHALTLLHLCLLLLRVLLFQTERYIN